MNLRSSIKNVALTLARRAGVPALTPSAPSTGGGRRHFPVGQSIVVWGMMALVTSAATAQTNAYNKYGSEYAVVGSLPGDQIYPDVALNSTGGFVVWQDNVTDGDNWGISARRLDSTLSGSLSSFRVNVTGAGVQENPHVALLKNGGAMFVWQGGKVGFEHIIGRLLTPTNTFLSTNDLQISLPVDKYQKDPALAVLNNSNVVVVWSSCDQVGANSMQDVYAKILSPSGDTVVEEFLVNQFTSFNQRSPSVTALKGGGFLITWVSEQQDKTAGSATNSVSFGYGANLNPSVDIYARVFSANGVASGNEFLVNTDNTICASPVAVAAADGTYIISWSGKDMLNSLNDWDVYGRIFNSSNAGGGVFYVNTTLAGSQYQPRAAVLGSDYLLTWTSFGQDGSLDGVFGQFIHSDGSRVGSEFGVNTTTIGRQMQPAIAADGVGQFLVVWSGYNGYPNTYDLFAQRFLNASVILQAMAAPFVWSPYVVSNGYQPRLVISWAPLQGLSVSNYEIYVDGALTNVAAVTGNQWTLTAANGLTASSTHSFQVDYVMNDGRRSPISPAASGSTWGPYNWGGIPFEWMSQYYGEDATKWPSVVGKLGGNGPTLQQVFVSGGNPLDSSTWLQTQLTHTANGLFLAWNVQPGATYQVQVTTNFNTWSNLGSARFAAGTTDSIYIGGNPVGYYRVLLIR